MQNLQAQYIQRIQQTTYQLSQQQQQQKPVSVPIQQPQVLVPVPVTIPVPVPVSVPIPAPAQQPNSITKEQVKDYLRQWIRVENEISTLATEIKKRKTIHQQLSASLMDVMRKNEIDCFDITNGKIVYSKTKTRPPLNKAQLKNALITYYKDDKETASSINEFLIASRVEKVREAIKMKIPK